MSDPSGLAAYILVNADSELENARVLTYDPGSGVAFNDFGPGGNIVFSTVDALDKINNLGSNGIVVGLGISPYFATRSITSNDGSLTVSNADGVDGDIDLSLGTGQSVQLITFQTSGVTAGNGTTLNLVPGSGVNITPSFNGGTKVMTYTLTSATHGTVTSVGLSSTSGLTIGGSPVTSSGTLTVNLPTGTTHQYLRIASTGPQTLEFATFPTFPDSLATYLCQTGVNLPTPNGINLGAATGKVGIGFTTPTYTIDARNITARATNDYRVARFVAQTAGSGSDFAGISVQTVLSPSNVFLHRAQGTIASLSTIAGAVQLGTIQFGGYNSSAYVTSAMIAATSTQAFTTSNQGTSLKFYTTPDNTNVPVPNLFIDQSGFISIGNKTGASFTPVSVLDVYNSLPASGNANDYTVARFVAKTAGVSNTNFGGLKVDTYGSYTSVALRASNGTSSTAADPLLTDDIIGRLDFAGNASATATASYFNVASIKATAKQDFGSGARGSKLEFFTVSQDDTTEIPMFSLGASTIGTSRVSVPDPTQERCALDVNFVGVGLGNAGTSAKLEVYSASGVATNDYSAAHFISDTNGDVGDNGGIYVDTFAGYSGVRIRRANGFFDSNFGSLGAVTLDQVIGKLTFAAYNGAAFADSSYIGCAASQDFDDSPAHAASRLEFWTVPVDSATAVRRMIIDQSGYVSMGLATLPTKALQVYNTAADAGNASDFTLARFDADVGSGTAGYYGGGTFTTYSTYATDGTNAASTYLNLRTAKGSFTSPVAILDKTELGRIAFWGSNSSSTYKNSASIVATSTEDYHANETGSRLDLFTTENGSGVPVLRMSIDQTGFVGLGLIENPPGTLPTPAYPIDLRTGSNVGSLATIAMRSTITANGSATCGNMIDSYTGASVGGSSHLFRTSRGTSGVPLHVQSGDTLMKLLAFGNAAVDGDPANFGTGATAAVSAKAGEEFTLGTPDNRGTYLTLETTPNGASTRAVSMTILGGGTTNAKVGIGMVPTHSLDLVNDDAYKASSAVWLFPSDERIKTDITNLTGALDVIKALQPRTFHYTENYHRTYEEKTGSNCYDPAVTQIGFIAQEIEQVLPQTVKTIHEDSTGTFSDFKILDIGILTPYLVKAVQELMAKVEALEAQLNKAA